MSGSEITGTTVHSYADYSPEVDEVDKRNINVRCNGKNMQVDMFPDEKIILLLREACQFYQKKEACMKMVYNGDVLNVNKTIREAQLRTGSSVNLIRAC
ncbi:hypothetical protein AALO_G00295780 [Alosa alosa]|uniref:Rad60/SUMO-like domain-containing protein n=1 Tax=Alosa alosa TaxID=278164 RepID=A0AAV6FFZ1_9TELE|nr:hypothetical protein AALO_G00295780 [Alosa alosa]